MRKKKKDARILGRSRSRRHRHVLARSLRPVARTRPDQPRRALLARPDAALAPAQLSSYDERAVGTGSSGDDAHTRRRPPACHPRPALARLPHTSTRRARFGRRPRLAHPSPHTCHTHTSTHTHTRTPHDREPTSRAARPAHHPSHTRVHTHTHGTRAARAPRVRPSAIMLSAVAGLSPPLPHAPSSQTTMAGPRRSPTHRRTSSHGPTATDRRPLNKGHGAVKRASLLALAGGCLPDSYRPTGREPDARLTLHDLTHSDLTHSDLTHT